MSLHKQLLSSMQTRVLGQLIEALLFEGWANGVVIADQTKDVQWTFGQRHYRAKGRRGAFGRYRLLAETITACKLPKRAIATWKPATIEQVLNDVGATGEARETLLRDLRHTAHLTNLNEQEIPALGNRCALGVSTLETALIEGHPYHPCFKARSGFSDDDHRQYGPEAGQVFRLIGVFVDKTLVHEIHPNPDFWLDEIGHDEWMRIHSVMIELGLSDDTNSLLPLHPWQWQSVKDHSLICDWVEQGLLHCINEFGPTYRATQSVRTLMNAQTPQASHVKTALAMRNTSSLRILDPENVAVAPAISRWIGQVIDSDPLFKTQYHLSILSEYASIIVGKDTPLAGHLAAIWRKSPESLGIPASHMMPLNALSMTEPDGKPLIALWIAQYGLETWVDQLIAVVVLPIWHMMVAHGIGLEAHGQNLILYHENGWPKGLIARDFHDSLEYTSALLSRPDLRPDLSQIDPVFADPPLNKYHEMADAEALRELVMDTLFVFCLADLSNLLMVHYQFDETRFWQAVRQQLDDYTRKNNLETRQTLFSPFDREIHTESLITAKIEPGRDVYRHLIPNALATSKEHL
jgi:siderophore synthetase component